VDSCSYGATGARAWQPLSAAPLSGSAASFRHRSSTSISCRLGVTHLVPRRPDGIARDEPRRRALWALVLAVAIGCIGRRPALT